MGCNKYPVSVLLSSVADRESAQVCRAVWEKVLSGAVFLLVARHVPDVSLTHPSLALISQSRTIGSLVYPSVTRQRLQLICSEESNEIQDLQPLRVVSESDSSQRSTAGLLLDLQS